MTRREWTIGLPIVVVMMLCLAAYLRGMGLANDAGVLTSLRVFGAADAQKVAAVIGSRLHVFDADGRRLADQDMRALGFSEDPNDMDWTVDAQGLTEAWFFEDTTPRVVRCAWDDAQQRLANCASAIAGAKLKVNAGSRAVHLAVDRPGERVFVTDARGGAVQVFDFGGKRLAKSDAGEVALDFPNRIRYLGANTLLVGDNDNGRAVWLAAEPGQPIRLLKALYAQDHGGARLAHSKVTDAAISPTGTLWMLAMRFGQADGDILVFDADHKPVRRAALRGDADPVIVEPLGDAALVGDFSPPRLYRVDAQGQVLGDFGDAAFRADLLPLQAQAEHASLWTRGAAIVAVVTFVVGMLLAWRFSERALPPGRIDAAALAGIERARASSAPLRFPIVIERSREHLRQERRSLWIGVALTVAMAGALVWFLLTSGKHLDFSGLPWRLRVQLIGGGGGADRARMDLVVRRPAFAAGEPRRGALAQRRAHDCRGAAARGARVEQRAVDRHADADDSPTRAGRQGRHPEVRHGAGRAEHPRATAAREPGRQCGADARDAQAQCLAQGAGRRGNRRRNRGDRADALQGARVMHGAAQP